MIGQANLAENRFLFRLFPVSTKPSVTDASALEQFRNYLRILVGQQIAAPFHGKLDLSGVVQETLWEAHQELDRGARVSQSQRLPWLRRILAHNLADAIRRLRR